MTISNLNSDIAITLSKNKFTNDFALVKDANSIRQSIINIILTIPGEKPFNQNFGTSINDYLFETYHPITSAVLATEIKNTVQLYETRALINEVLINDSPIVENTGYIKKLTSNPSDLIDAGILYIYISYSVNHISSTTPMKDAISLGLIKVR